MALFLNGKQLLNSLVVDGDSKASTPTILFAQNKNKSSIVTSSYTFTENGKFQFYIFEWSENTIPSTKYAIIKLNDTVITPSVTVYDAACIYYGEIEANANDVFSVKTQFAESNRGIQTFVLKDAKISKYRFLGFRGNDNITFNIPAIDGLFLQSYMCSYYNGATTFNYQICAYAPRSVPTPNDSNYYYGCTWAVQIT